MTEANLTPPLQMSNQAWRSAFKAWLCGEESNQTIERLIRKHQKFEIDIDLIQDDLSQLHQQLDRCFLSPKLIPISLLLNPSAWTPSSIPTHDLALLSHHRDLANSGELLSSGVLNQILKGERSLYGDLPAIPIRAYFEGLNKEQRQICREQKLSALEHLATEGWRRHRNNQPTATGLDRYHFKELPRFSPEKTSSSWDLLVAEGDINQANQLALHGGWEKAIPFHLNNLAGLAEALNHSSSEWVSICHASDILAYGARHALAGTINHGEPSTIITCDDIIHHQCWDDEAGYDHRQYRSSISNYRLFTRGGAGGLLTLPRHLLTQTVFQKTYTCLECLRLDILLQAFSKQQKTAHLHQPLARSFRKYNPCLPEQGWPRERCPFNAEQLLEIENIRMRHGAKQLEANTAIEKNPLQEGCHSLKITENKSTTISIIIPFRDKWELTSACVQSIQTTETTQGISYEIILVDNGSEDEKTLSWLQEISRQTNVQCIRIDEPFNYSKLNNTARKSCKGDYLLFLNNDIEWRSKNVLQQLLDPFAHPSTAAVGCLLHYPDGSIQHQGVVIVPGERRTVLEPGKHLQQDEVIESLLPLRNQEEFSAASAACLLVKSSSFDAIGGFDEDLAVVFNDVDLCLRLRENGGKIIVTPCPLITHHESISRGKDQIGEAWSRHQRESGRLRHKHRDTYKQGDPLTSPLLHHHSNRFEPAPFPERPIGKASEQILFTWVRELHPGNSKPPLIFAQYEADPEVPIRADILDLLREYRRFFHVQVVAATPSLLEKRSNVRALQKACDGLIIRRNEGYDYGSWMTGIRFCRELIEHKKQLILCNDSFWGPVRPIEPLIQRLNQTDADIIGLTDNLMYEPHLQSPFLMFKERALSCPSFWHFWNNINCWKSKRSIVKHYEVGLPALLQAEGLRLTSLYSKNANGNILHSDWKNLIEEQGFPFLKISLLRDNPHQIDISGWDKVVSAGNKRLASQIKRQLTGH